MKIFCPKTLAFYPVDIVHADRIHEPGHDVFLVNPFVGGGFNIGTDERGALVVEIGRPLARQRDFFDVLIIDPACLLGGLFEKGPRSAEQASFIA